MNGKGDVPRPLFVSRKTFEAHWDLAFGNKQRNVPDPVSLIDSELQPLERSLVFADCSCGENNRGLRESDNTVEASGSTIQTPSNT